MVLGYAYATPARQYIDMTEAEETDRVLVTLEDGASITLKPLKHDQFTIDLDTTDQRVIIELDRQFRAHFAAQSWPTRRAFRAAQKKGFSPIYEVNVSADSATFDDSPRVGERLCIMVAVSGLGGLGAHLKSPVREVSFFPEKEFDLAHWVMDHATSGSFWLISWPTGHGEGRWQSIIRLHGYDANHPFGNKTNPYSIEIEEWYRGEFVPEDSWPPECASDKHHIRSDEFYAAYQRGDLVPLHPAP